ncbi:MAG: tetratricopeptide repeat protein [Promethearchaeota archaeon]|jgi:tetratricopeptide (TPR) repeat protein
MPESVSDELMQVEELISENQMDEALDIVKKIARRGRVYFDKNDHEKALEMLLRCQEYFEKIGKKYYIAYNSMYLAEIYSRNGDFPLALEYGMKSLTLWEELKNQKGIAAGLSLVGRVYDSKWNFDLAIEFSKRSLSIEEIRPDAKAQTLHQLSLIYQQMGELDQALNYGERCLKFAKKYNLKYYIARSLSLIGLVYLARGNFNRSKEYNLKSLTLSEKEGFNFPMAESLLGIIILIDTSESDLEEAKKYSERLKRLADKNTTNRFLKHAYLTSRAVILNSSTRSKDRAEVELLLNQVIKDKMSSRTLYTHVIIMLCEFLIEELKISNDLKVLDEINPVIDRLLFIAEKSHSYYYQVQAKRMQSKLALIQMNFKDAKLFLSEAQQIAEMHDLHVFPQIISGEHDHLLEQQDMWEHLKKTKAPMVDRINLASFDGIIPQLQGRLTLEPEELVDEQPILLLIIAEGGFLVFSYLFSEDWKFDDELFSGFLTAFNSISDEIFSEGLDRVKFGKQTVLMEQISNFSICYLFKGQTYPAKQKFNEFIKRLQEKSLIFQTLENYYKTSQVAELTDIPSIEPIILEIFIGKS